jgi:hypothetical protein
MCECKKQLEKRVAEVKKTDIKNCKFQEFDLISGKTHNSVKVETFKGKRKFVDIILIQHTFCPFCGAKYE